MSYKKQAMLRILMNSGLKISLQNKRTFMEQPRSGYPDMYTKSEKKLGYFRQLYEGYRIYKEEVKCYFKELRSSYTLFPVQPAPNEHDVVWKFDGSQNLLNHWIVNSDSDYHHGFSTAKLELSPNGTGIFHGVLDTRVRKDGRSLNSGYCNITTTPRYTPTTRRYKYNWSRYNALVLRVRGDGRIYMLNILQRGRYDVTWYSAYHYFMYTRGGPYWQTVTIPFSKFVFSTKGEINDIQFEMPKRDITNFGITLADKKSGPFRLEIDYIGLSYDPSLTEKCAYEMYDVVRE